MGNMCNSKMKPAAVAEEMNPVDSLFATFGDDIAKFVVAQKSKQALDQKVIQVKNTVTGKSKQLRKKAINIIDQEEQKTDKTIDSTFTKLEQDQPGAVKKAQAINRKPLKEMLGLHEISKQYTELKNEVNDEFDKGEQQIIDDIESQKDIQRKNIDESKPKIPAYDNLPEQQQKKIFDEAEKKFKPQIDEQQGKVRKQIQEKMNVDKYLQKFKDIDPSKKVTEISKQGEQLLGKANGMVTKTSLFC